MPFSLIRQNCVERIHSHHKTTLNRQFANRHPPKHFQYQPIYLLLVNPLFWPTCDVQAILRKLPGAGSLMSASEYINIDATEATEQEITDDEIVQAVLCEAEDSDLETRDEEEEEEEPDFQPPSLHEARQAMTVLLRFFETNNNTTVEEMDKILSVEKLLKEKTLKNLCQTKITGYFSAP